MVKTIADPFAPGTAVVAAADRSQMNAGQCVDYLAHTQAGTTQTPDSVMEAFPHLTGLYGAPSSAKRNIASALYSRGNKGTWEKIGANEYRPAKVIAIRVPGQPVGDDNDNDNPEPTAEPVPAPAPHQGSDELGTPPLFEQPQTELSHRFEQQPDGLKEILAKYVAEHRDAFEANPKLWGSLEGLGVDLPDGFEFGIRFRGDR